MSRSRPVLIYDDACGFCRSSVRLVRALDWLRRVELVGIGEARAAACLTPEEREAARSAIALRSGERVVFGVDALRRVGLRLPLLALPALLLWVPGLYGLARWGYRQTARRRYRISRWLCGSEACGVAPPEPSGDGRDREATPPSPESAKRPG